MPEFVIIAILLAIAVVGGMLAFGRSLLLSLYLREVRRVTVPPDPDDEIVTYPLA